MNGLDGASQKDFTSSVRDIDREGAGHLPVVDDAGGWYPERRKAVRVRLARSDSVAPDELEFVDSIGSPPLVEFGESLPLAFPDRDDELACQSVGDAVLITVLEQPRASLPAEASLERAWLIVNAGVYDSAVAAGLVEA
jgi:hypothetical protein